jgi:hypothetical protein
MPRKTKATTYKCPHCGRGGVTAAKGYLKPHMSPGGMRCTMAFTVSHIPMVEAARKAR